MNSRTEKLRNIMREHRLTDADVASLVGRKPHTVTIWRSAKARRIIPDHTLELLEFKLLPASVRGCE